MIRSLEFLISAELLHGDIKLDNWLIYPETDPNATTPLRLTLTDFGRSIDRRAYPPGTRFRFNASTLACFGNNTKELVCGAQWRMGDENEGEGSWLDSLSNSHTLDFVTTFFHVFAFVMKF